MRKGTTYHFVSRVSKSCAHDVSFRTIFRMKNPNLIPTFADDFLERGSPEYRDVMRAKGTLFDLTGNYDHDLDWYIVTRCDKCDAQKIMRWNEAHWHESPWERQSRFVRALTLLACERTLTESDKLDVLNLVRTFHLTYGDFKLLDEKPGNYDHDGQAIFIDGRKAEWHWKLRQVRNTTAALFEALKLNEEDGYTDENTIPPIPLMLFNLMD